MRSSADGSWIRTWRDSLPSGSSTPPSGAGPAPSGISPTVVLLRNRRSGAWLWFSVRTRRKTTGPRRYEGGSREDGRTLRESFADALTALWELADEPIYKSLS